MPRKQPPPPEWKPLLTPDEAAALLGISRDTVDALIKRGAISAIDLGNGDQRRSYRIPSRQLLDDLDALARDEAEGRRPCRSVKREA